MIRDLVGNLDDWSGWLAAVVAGLAALGWLLKRIRTFTKALLARAHDVAKKIDTLEELAGYELNSNGGGSIKDRVGKIPKLSDELDDLKGQFLDHLKQCPPPSTATTVVVAPEATTVTTGEAVTP